MTAPNDHDGNPPTGTPPGSAADPLGGPLANLTPEQHAHVRDLINSAAANARRTALGRAERNPPPPAASQGPSAQEIARRAAAFASAGYAADEIEHLAADLSYSLPPPPPRSASLPSTTSRVLSSVPGVPGVTSRGTAPPSSVPGDDVPILSMSIPERMALRQKIGDVEFAKRNEREMLSRNVRVKV